MIIPVKGQSQYATHVDKRFRSSACGPVTVSVILDYWGRSHAADELYRLLGATKIGTFRFLLARRLQRFLGPAWTVASTNQVDAVMAELKRGRPVAAKFDKYFTLQFFKQPMYAYHWVVLVGYEISDGVLFFFCHDNGAPGRDSRIRRFEFSSQSSVLRFVTITPPDS